MSVEVGTRMQMPSVFQIERARHPCLVHLVDPCMRKSVMQKQLQLPHWHKSTMVSIHVVLPSPAGSAVNHQLRHRRMAFLAAAATVAVREATDGRDSSQTQTWHQVRCGHDPAVIEIRC